MLWAMCVVGAVMAIALDIPLGERLSRLVLPSKPREELVRRGIEQARRRTDHLLH